MKYETIDRIRKFTEDRNWDQFQSSVNFLILSIVSYFIIKYSFILLLLTMLSDKVKLFSSAFLIINTILYMQIFLHLFFKFSSFKQYHCYKKQETY